MSVSSSNSGTEGGSLVTFRIKAGGNVLPASFEVLGITVTREVNRIPTARLVCLDGDAAAQDFALSASAQIQPGKDIEILAGYDSKDSTLFKGIVTRLRIRAGRQGSELIIECRDKCIALTTGRRCASYAGKTDSDNLKSLIQDAGLTAKVTATSVTHEDFVQFNATDWDFIVTRAEANGQVVFVHDGVVTIDEPKAASAADIELEYGANLFEFEAQIDAAPDTEDTWAESWSASTQAAQKQGSGTKYQLQHGGARPSDELSVWLKAVNDRATLAQVRGRAQVQGRANVLPGQTAKFSGVGDTFSGKLLFISAVEHQIAKGNWLTQVQVGLATEWFHQRPQVDQPPAGGLLPAVSGLQIGLVTKIDEDPQNEFRVQVQLPLVGSQAVIWARMARLDAGAGRGVVFWPEINDEVVLGFLHSDPRDAVILGILHSSKNASPIVADPKNPQKGITTRSKLQVLFDDEKKIITIATPAGHSIALDEDAKTLTLTDLTKNTVTMSESGVKIVSNKHSIELNAGGIEIISKGNLTLKADGKVSIKGVNIEANADASFKAEGQTGAQVTTSGIAVLKGSLVQIN
ncbi:MAG: type secretion protein Rhs [Verrucomicrobiaceae bacterium]|nr:type secretion protein Rhs [Verrucomicrobiaceae bacterium]